MKLCTVPDCTGPHYARGRCRRHYETWRDTTDEKPRCSLDGCDRPVKARGWCSTHYRQWLQGNAPHHVGAPERPACSVDGCDRAAVCRTYCNLHYRRWRRTGTTELPARKVKSKPAAKARPKPKPADKLPPGWFKPTPRSSERMTTNHVERVDTLLPLESTSMAIVAHHAPVVRRLLARHDALDLADMLGVS